MSRNVIGIDLGGTNCRVGLVSGDGKIVKSGMHKVPSDRSQKGIIDFLSKLCSEMISEDKVAGIGIGAPGIVDFSSGTVIRSPHYSAWQGYSLKNELSKSVGLPVVLDNDANMIAAGEMWLGAGKEFKNFIMITLGTGIGGGIVLDKNVFRGDCGFAGEIGHMVLMFDGIKCDCGGKGCWETIVSADGIKILIERSDDPQKEKFMAKFHNQIDKVTPKDVYEHAKDGDLFAISVWKKFGAYFGAGLASLANVTGVLSYVVGGGLANASDLFMPEAKREIAKRTYKETAERIKIERALLGENAGILGAAKTILST